MPIPDPGVVANIVLSHRSRYQTVSYDARADLSGLVEDGTGEIRQFSAEVHDEVVGETTVTDGGSEFAVPPYSVVLVRYVRAG